ETPRQQFARTAASAFFCVVRRYDPVPAARCAPVCLPAPLRRYDPCLRHGARRRVCRLPYGATIPCLRHGARRCVCHLWCPRITSSRRGQGRPPSRSAWTVEGTRGASAGGPWFDRLTTNGTPTPL